MGGDSNIAAILKQSHEVLDHANKIRPTPKVASAAPVASDYVHAREARKAEPNVGDELAAKGEMIKKAQQASAQ